MALRHFTTQSGVIVVVHTNHIYPPIPIRAFDWSAVQDGYEPPDPIGYGYDEQGAIEDLREQIEERDAAFVEVM